MKVNRLKLVNDVSKALPGIATGTVAMEGADSLVFVNDHIYSYNSSISVNVEESEKSGLKGVVKAQDFYNCITKLPSDEVDVEVTDTTWKITDGKIKVTMKLLPQGDILERFKKLLPTEDWTDIDGVDFQNALKVCLIKGDTSPFAGVYFKDNVALATNKYIINKYNLKNNYPEFWVSIASAQELIKWDNFEKVQFDKQWLHFKSADGAVFSVRTLATDNYAYDKIMGIYETAMKKEIGLSIDLTDNFFDSISRASSFSNLVDDHDTVAITFGKECSVEGSRLSGDYSEIIDGLTVENLESPVTMKFDVGTFLLSSKIFSKFIIYSADGKINGDEFTHVSLQSDNCVKLFSNVIEC